MANKQYILPVCSASGSGGGSSISLETNGVSNSNQSLLNLAAGTNVTLSNSAGTTTINATGAGGISTARVTISSAQLIAGSLVQVIAAPGVGSYIVPIYCLMNYKFITAAYTVSTQTLVFYIGTGKPWAQLDASGFLDQSSDQIATSFSNNITTALPPVCSNINISGNSPIQESVADNAPGMFQLVNGGSPISSGSGTVDVIVWYSTIAKA